MGFIEVITDTGNAVLINIDSIATVFVDSRTENLFIRFKSEFLEPLIVREDLSTVRKKIKDARKEKNTRYLIDLSH